MWSHRKRVRPWQSSDPIGYHAINKLDDTSCSRRAPAPKRKKYSQVFGEGCAIPRVKDERLVGITPAMCEGSDLIDFSKRFPDRYFDVAIAEQHAVTLAAGLA